MRSHRTCFFVLFILIAIAPGLCAAAELASSAVLTTADEPGEPLHVTGTVYGSDGETPVAGVELYVFHTDARGYYAEEVMDNQNPRLNARIRTDAEGRYQFRTIKPGPYPYGGVAAHVHYIAKGGGYEEQSFELHFAGDPELGEEEIERSRDLGRFGSIRAGERGDDGVLRIVHDLRLRD